MRRRRWVLAFGALVVGACGSFLESSEHRLPLELIEARTAAGGGPPLTIKVLYRSTPCASGVAARAAVVGQTVLVEVAAREVDPLCLDFPTRETATIEVPAPPLGSVLVRGVSKDQSTLDTVVVIRPD